MKIYLKLIQLFFVAFPFTCYGPIVTLKVMVLNNHWIRVAGDLHHTAFADSPDFEYMMELERSSVESMAEPLARFLHSADSKQECIIAEKIIVSLLDIAEYIDEALSTNDPAAISLITRLNILGHPDLDNSLKLKAAHIGQYILSPQIEINAFDLRSEYSQVCYLCFPTNKAEYERLYRELYARRNAFKSDINALLATRVEYDPVFKNFMERHAQSLILKMRKHSYLEDFFTYDFPDFGYLDFIARNADKNITLFLGAAHAENISRYLEIVGYQTVFQEGTYSMENLKNNILPKSLSEKGFQNFFRAAGLKTAHRE